MPPHDLSHTHTHTIFTFYFLYKAIGSTNSHGLRHDILGNWDTFYTTRDSIFSLLFSHALFIWQGAIGEILYHTRPSQGKRDSAAFTLLFGSTIVRME